MRFESDWEQSTFEQSASEEGPEAWEDLRRALLRRIAAIEAQLGPDHPSWEQHVSWLVCLEQMMVGAGLLEPSLD